jgi:hypothetical protein
MVMGEHPTDPGEALDLLEALEKLLRADELPPSEKNCQLAIDAMQNARAAIAKARGEL